MSGMVEKHQSLRRRREIKETSFVAEIRRLFWRKKCVFWCEGSGFCGQRSKSLVSLLLHAHLDEQQQLWGYWTAKKPSALLHIWALSLLSWIHFYPVSVLLQALIDFFDLQIKYPNCHLALFYIPGFEAVFFVFFFCLSNVGFFSDLVKP